MSNQIEPGLNPAQLFSRYVLTNSLSGFTDQQRAQLIGHLCKTWHLDFNQQPFIIIKTQGKEKLYLSKAGAEQVRNRNNVSIDSVDTKIEDGLVLVTAAASLPSGRHDSDLGTVSIKGLVGDALADAILKAVTKAKRRVTLSICGLPMSEVSDSESAPKSGTNGGSTAELNHLVGAQPKPKVKKPPMQTYSEQISARVLNAQKDQAPVEERAGSAEVVVRKEQMSKAKKLARIETLEGGPLEAGDLAEVERLKGQL